MEALWQKPISALYREMFPVLMAYAQTVLSPATAEEAVQETFEIACQKPEDLFSSPNPRGWLMNTLKNTIRNIQKDREMVSDLLGQYLLALYGQCNSAEDELPLKELYADMADTEAFRLLYEHAVIGLSQKEIAETRGISLAACRKRIQRAKAELKKIL